MSVDSFKKSATDKIVCHCDFANVVFCFLTKYSNVVVYNGSSTLFHYAVLYSCYSFLFSLYNRAPSRGIYYVMESDHVYCSGFCLFTL